MSAPDSHAQHNHSHGHSHNHGAGASRGRLLVALCLSATVLVAEIITALLTGSLALFNINKENVLIRQYSDAIRNYEWGGLGLVAAGVLLLALKR